MQNDDNELCIRYVMNELDPFEVAMVEQTLAANDDMLIEIESLRRTWKRLESMPALNPPDTLVDEIMNQAVSYRNTQPIALFGGGEWNQRTWFASAAILLISVTLGIAGMLGSGLQSVTGSSKESVTDETATAPWIDNQNILHINHFDAQGILNAGAIEFNGNFQRLRDAEGNAIFNPIVRDVQLTRTQN